MLWQLHILKDLSDLTQSLVTDLLNRIILKAKTNRNKRENSNIVSNKVKKVNLAEPGPSCTVPLNGETSGLCSREVEEANRQWKGLVRFLSIVTQIAPLSVIESSNNFKLI